MKKSTLHNKKNTKNKKKKFKVKSEPVYNAQKYYCINAKKSL